MNARNIFILTICIFIFIHATFAQHQDVSVLRTDWKFAKGNHENAAQKGFDDSGWESVVIPHDWAIEGPFIKDGDGNTGKLPWKGEGWYRKKMNLPEHYRGKRLYLLFDGVMAFPSVYVNGKEVGKWDYGYNSFYIDVTEAMRVGEVNVLAIHVDTRQHDSRWYPGAGVYRKVQLIAVNPVHVAIWGSYITTPIIKPHYADVRIATTINNHSAATTAIRVKQIIYTPSKIKIAEKEVTAGILSGKDKLVEVTLTVTNPRRWDVDDPYLYSLVTEIYHDDKVVDTYASTFGIRDIRFTADHGFYLNDRRVQLRGVNLHHDFGPLGAAFNVRAMERQLEIMKSMGVNAIRNSHNTAAPEVLELCDRLGLLMFNEIFDKYDAKAGITDTTDFEEFAHRNIRNFVVRDRNHPSVFLWSVGNEIGDVQWNINNGFQRLQTMLNYVRKFDASRPTTLVCDSYASANLRHFDYYDVHSWNYGRRYSLARQLEPNKAVIISESASTVSTRGFYEFPLPEEKTNFTKSLQVSSYDLNAPDWAEISDDDFMWQQDEPYIAGEFVWTGFDYLGEPTPYTNQWAVSNGMTDAEASRSSYFGIVDLVGIPKDRYYLYKSYWKPEETTVHILPHWNWENRIGQNVPVFVYTNGDCAELFLNGKSLGMKCKKPKSERSIERFRLMWNDVKYQPGELLAVAYKAGVKIGEHRLKTAGKAVAIRLSPDRKTIKANGEDLSYILVEAIDKDGNVCPLADTKVDIKIAGAGKLAGVGNGNPQSFNSFKSSVVNLFHGKAMVIVSSEWTKGNITVEASSAGMKSSKINLLTE
ncbi:MAG TPA: glycoside hydrolase family 2 TIM barrel-domain containing protein [Cyclobacteriaceae bacterium]|nr:glycoside hydrolase family 2 TIM barrel-domain containing protein [Cyclobacteriaceae bacterium]HRJ83983.1 glycoside hydrolase family 2 TIM barrel-domain containing protein [Cyclobacteriaceae bacterium]